MQASLPVAQAQLLRWMNDDEANECGLCRSEFTIFNRRHHCRKCGALFCQDCCSYFIVLNPEQILYPPNLLSYTLDLVVGNTVRCCKTCADTVIGGNLHTRTTYSIDDAIPAPRPTEESSDMNANSTAGTNDKAPTVDNNNPDSNIIDSSGTPTASTTSNATISDVARDVSAPVMREVYAMEYVPGEPSKRYIVNVPSDIRRGGTFSVYLDSRIMTVRLTVDVNPGERIYVRAPTVTVVPIPAVARAVARDDNSASSSIAVLLTVPCNVCTYENTISHHSAYSSMRCHFCNTLISLQSEDTSGHTSGASSGTTRRVNVLEMPSELLQHEEDARANNLIKQYSVIVPSGTQPNEIFKVVLSARLFHVLCPPDAHEGNKLIVSAPDKSCPFPLNYRFKFDCNLVNAAPDKSSDAPSTATQDKHESVIDPDVLFVRANHQMLLALISDQSNDVPEEDKIAMLLAAGVASSDDDARTIIKSCIAKNAEKNNSDVTALSTVSYNIDSSADNSGAIVAAATSTFPEGNDLLFAESKESNVAVDEAVAVTLPQATIVEAREVCTYIMDSKAVDNELIAIAEETILCRYCTSVNHPDARVCLVCRRRFQ